ncbi:hypothetical protein RB200_09095 [Streptomyces sp. PmtG]
MSIAALTSASARLRLTALVAAPLLALAVGCGSGDDDGGGEDEQVASVPGEKDTGAGKAGSADKDAGADKSGKSAFYDAQMEYVRCMRTKAGLKDFPDPKLSGYLDQSEIEKVKEPGDTGFKYKGGKDGVCFPEMEAAMNKAPKRNVQKDYESMLAHAKCMRDNGLSEFRNPTLSDGNVQPGGDPNPVSPKYDPDSPTYRGARDACADKLLDGLDGMQ